MLKNAIAVCAIAVSLTACGTMGPGSPGPSIPTPAPKPAAPDLQPYSIKDAETACLMQGSRKFGVPISHIKIADSASVDAGYRIRMDAGGATRTCIIAKDGFVRSLR